MTEVFSSITRSGAKVQNAQGLGLGLVEVMSCIIDIAPFLCPDPVEHTVILPPVDLELLAQMVQQGLAVEKWLSPEASCRSIVRSAVQQVNRNDELALIGEECLNVVSRVCILVFTH